MGFRSFLRTHLVQKSIQFCAVALLFVLASFSASAQTVTCFATSTVPTVRSEGLVEQVGDMILNCSGGAAGSTATIGTFVKLNTNVTNRLDTGGLPIGVTVTSLTPFTGSVSVSVSGSTSLFIQNIAYVVPSPSTTPVAITISGIRAAAGVLANGAGTSVITATFLGFGMQYTGIGAVPVAQTNPALIYSVINNGIPCAGATAPPTLDFPGFLAAPYASSAARITEGSINSFSVAGAGDDTGTRIVIKYSGYGSGVRLFVPDAIVGNDSISPTNEGSFGATASGGIFTNGSGQLLLSRVSGANINGIGGTLTTPLPAATTSFTALTELTVIGGAAYAVYEVISANPGTQQSAQVPVFLVTAPNNCASSAQTTIAPALVPISTVTIASATDPIPRFVAVTSGSDCQFFNDCSGSYFPKLATDQSSLTLNGASLGNPRSTSLAVLNQGGSQMSFQVTIAYQTGTGWLTVTPTSGVNSTTLTVTASPATLQSGTYSATLNINAGAAGQIAVPVSFVVGPQGVTIQSVVSAATFQTGQPIAPGSYAAIFGLNLSGTNVGVTFNGLAGKVAYVSPPSATYPQINVILPNLGIQTNASVLATVDGKTSDPFVIKLAPNTPGIFSTGIVNSNGGPNTATTPARRGDFISIYMTGLQDPLSGPVTVNIGTTAAGTGLIPLYAGIQGTFPGLDQVNVVIPAGLTVTGAQPLNVCVVDFTGNVCSNQVNVYVQ